MTVAMRRTHCRAGHAVGGVLQFADIGGLDRLGEAWPAASRFIFVDEAIAVLPIRCRRRCPVPCYPDIRRFRGAPCRSWVTRYCRRQAGIASGSSDSLYLSSLHYRIAPAFVFLAAPSCSSYSTARSAYHRRLFWGIKRRTRCAWAFARAADGPKHLYVISLLRR